LPYSLCASVPGLDALVLQAQAHGAAQVAFFERRSTSPVAGAPFGDQADHRMLALLVVLGAVGVVQVQHVARVIDHRRLHAVADAEVRARGARARTSP
jgi:hypothetical protein